MTRALKSIRVPSPLRTLLPLPPLSKCNLCRIRKQEFFSGYTHGRGCCLTNLLYLFLGRLILRTLYPQEVKTIWQSGFLLFFYLNKATNHLTYQCFGIERKKAKGPNLLWNFIFHLGKTPLQLHVVFASQPSLKLLLLQFRHVRTFPGSCSYKIYVISGREYKREWTV